ncbi:MAG: hypothetical protein KGL98_07290 [Gammaproteobacteria bacterium]|nr:hypothetical protein [Gammaproteobacteria bacterium]MBU6509987.1 hypothetical protein [Gammaproteobacteria bacterium]MDE2109330.1 hypothetical protein [Gammaproteobacteria bacterium]MDE2461038.1 hypothetical protein [Gammaproteobacteria bacterium]
MVLKDIIFKFAITFLLSAALLGGCATTPNIAALETEGATRHVPVLIYYVSWNAPVFAGNRMEAQLLNTGNKDISSIKLLLANCEDLRDLNSIKTFTLQGPFVPNQLYTAYPTSRGAMVSMVLLYRAVIVKIAVIDSDGMEHEYLGKEVTPLLGKDVVNSCLG